MTRSAKLRERIAAGILDEAARVLGERGEAVNMEEVAEAAGVSRATLYRYFPTRDELVRALEAAALDELEARIGEAELDAVPVREGIARLARGFLDAGDKYVALIRSGRKLTDPSVIDRRVTEPVRALFRRGVEDGTLRGDLPPEMLLGMFTGLLESAVQTAARPRMGTEAASAAVTTLFLTGALNPGNGG